MRDYVRLTCTEGYAWVPRMFAFDPTDCTAIIKKQRLGDLVEIVELPPKA